MALALPFTVRTTVDRSVIEEFRRTSPELQNLEAKIRTIQTRLGTSLEQEFDAQHAAEATHEWRNTLQVLISRREVGTIITRIRRRSVRQRASAA